MVFLSLGAGVQSSVMLMMGINSEIERPDHVIFADTGFEPINVYKHAAWLKKQCKIARIPFHRVTGNMTMRAQFDTFEAGYIKAFNNRPPFFVINQENGMRGTMLRQCTRDAKIRPVERKMIELLGYTTAREASHGQAVLQIGISTDEARRASQSRKTWIERSYPLIDPRKFTRGDCQAWWDRNYPDITLPSSACVICPYLTTDMRRRMKENAHEDWAVAVEYDKRFRAAYEKTGQKVFIHKSLLPLEEVNFNEEQTEFDFDEEMYCAGGCGL